ncbi:MAG: hypothetical protein ACFB2X_21995 [Rivularia sp. (in: cyanobacteria)]
MVPSLRYPDLATAINHICQQWCQENGYTEPFYRNGELWAFPPNGVMPVKIKDVMDKQDSKQVWIGRVCLFILPDGSVAKVQRQEAEGKRQKGTHP